MQPAALSFIGLGLWFVLACLTLFNPELEVAWLSTGLALLLLALFDALQSRALPTPTVTRRVAGSVALGVWSEVQLSFYNPSPQPCQLAVFDDYPVSAELQGQPVHVSLAGLGRGDCQYRLRPQQRGSVTFAGVYLQLRSPWGFWTLRRYQPQVNQVKVYPNFAAVAGYALFATENRLGQLGIRKQQRRGEGMDFHQLREYRAGDSLRQIDWKATSRQRKLISKEYQDERDQQVIFLLDCGRRMLAQDDTLSHFDHSLNAVLLLAYVALRQGDALGLLTFSGALRWLSPRKGLLAINQVLNTLYDLYPQPRPSDYLEAARQLMSRSRKRALVVLVTNLRDEDSEELQAALRLLRKKHLVLLVSLQEKVLNEVLEQPVENFADALRQAATWEYLSHRRQTHEKLQQQGILYLDTEPAKLPVALVNYYLAIKRSGRL